MKTNWLRTMSMMGLGLLATVSVGRAGGPGDLPGPIDSLSDLQDSGRMLFKMADENNDGQISQKEAVDAGNLLVGGFFFRADANGDGVLSRDEVKQARDSFLADHPLMRILVQKNQAAVAATPGSPAANAEQMFEALVDTNHDGNLQANEVRQIVQTGVAALFASADTNRDGQLSPTEVNAALIGMANAAAQTAFNAADIDRNGQISQAEFDKAIVEPANAIFRAMDANNDGQLSPQEAQSARQTVLNQVKRLRVPEPSNSARNLINTGANPAQVAPVPSFGQPATPATQPR
jgi:Ca2+-binding EF-hand superfamily protein